MKRILFCCLPILVVCVYAVSAGELPPLALENGENRIALTLVNASGSDIPTVSASVDNANIPAWLSVQSETGAINAPKGTRTQEKLFLIFTLKDAPAGAETVVPLTLSDALGNTWSYRVTIRADAPRPLPDALIWNFPNPFNPDTAISFSLASGRSVSIAVYNALGQKVRTLVDGPRAAGKHTVRWDGHDDAGRSVSSGVYFCTMTAGKYRNTMKMLFAQ